jgi:plasmid stabilization system protein ParE
MEYKVIWSNFAEYQLDLIFNYYTESVHIELAKKILFQIKSSVEKLYKNPFIGKKEELLSDRMENYRYLIVTNYKVIYSVNEQTKMIKIADIFDTRQNPIKLKRN